MPLVDFVISPDVRVAWRVGADKDTVWRHLTDAALLPLWLGRLVGGSVTGNEFTIDHGEGHLCRSTVTTLDPPRALAFTWDFPHEPTSNVTLALNPDDDATLLHLTHRGLGPLTTEYADGWCTHLTYLEAAVLGTPLPMTRFWQLHATVSRLRTGELPGTDPTAQIDAVAQPGEGARPPAE
ncbi:SRPBCC domain-containing protein [Promicromonospora soli]